MRVLHLSTYDLYGGAAKAAFRLHTALAGAGVDSWMLVRRKDSDRDDVLGPAGFQRPWAKVQRRVERALRLCGVRGEFSPAVLPDGLAKRIQALRPDVVHAHWVAHGFLRLETLAGLGFPVVWTMHDMWPFTGGCHYTGDCERYQTGCGRCPLLGEKNEDDASSRGVERRRSLLARRRIRFVAPSRWLAGCAQKSVALRQADVRVIPYTLDTALFSPRDQAGARRNLGLPVEAQVILAGAMDLGAGERKGLPALWTALGKLGRDAGAKPLHVALFGTRERRCITRDGLTIHELGYLKGEAAMAEAYAAADIFVAPSAQDNLPNTVMEALAVGTPVAGFAVGGIPDMVHDGENGLLVAPGDAEGLAHAMARLLGDAGFRAGCARNARAGVLRRYAAEPVVAAYRELYAACGARP